MAESLTAARPYAKALYEVAAKDRPQSWLPLMQVCEALGHDEETRRFLGAHDLTLEKFNNVLGVLLDKAKIDSVPEKFNNFTAVLAHNKRFVLLPEIANLFIEAVNQSNDTVMAEIISAKPISAESEAKLLSKLEKKYGKTVEASITIDESLIGGAVIKIGDTVIDGSVRGRLEQLTKALN
ncbi:MAG: F0F1 ATP synthase subunit delta [Gammaproteobacteria bacterium]|nr:MAG: F0F1 ATP synthase subunit delta [Gammaproteobacteria bacterium]